MVIINYHLWWTIESLYALNVVLVQLKVWSGDGIKLIFLILASCDEIIQDSEGMNIWQIIVCLLVSFLQKH